MWSNSLKIEFGTNKRNFLCWTFIMIFFSYIIIKSCVGFFKNRKLQTVFPITTESYISVIAYGFRDETLLDYNPADFMIVKKDKSHVARGELIGVKISKNIQRKFYTYKHDMSSSNKIKFLNLTKNNIHSLINKEIVNLKLNSCQDLLYIRTGILDLIRQYEQVRNKNYEIYSEVSQKMEDSSLIECTENNKIISQNSGYFSSYVDGIENYVDFNYLLSDLENFNFENFKKYEENMSNIDKYNNNNKFVGKIVKSPNCIIICKLKKNEIEQFKSKKSIDISLDLTKEFNISCEVISVLDSDLLVLSVNLTEYFVNFRKETIKIQTKKISGFKILKDYIHFLETNKTGVYVKRKSKYNLIPVNILGEKDNYYICENVPDSVDKLNTYDRISIY
ncbi:MAG: hypothetical protein NkDv07_0750 [Candidatus Improbicoccus devescovinae]|nr:MAG: hypothetical protein NkDv07_0750 [Candidatus Improbicoccus devescovinae]